MMGMLLPLGIERGKEFKPDAATVVLLKTAAAEAVIFVSLPTNRYSHVYGFRLSALWVFRP